MSIVVTGATGRLGHHVVESLLERGTPPSEIVATGRNVEKAADLAGRGVRTVALSFEEVPDGVIGAGDVVLLVSGSEVGQRVRQHGNVIDAARRAGAARIVYTSAPAASDTTLVLAPEHAATEELIRASGLPFTILRNGWYTENYTDAFAQAAATGEVLSSTAGGRVASAPIAEYAEAAAVVLLDEAYAGRVLELSGDRAWDFDELAATFGEVLGRAVTHRSVSPEEHVQVLREAGLDEGTAGFVAALDGNIAEGLLAVTSGELSRVIGHPTTPLADTVKSWSV